MRIIDYDKKRSIKAISLYLTEDEASHLKDELELLLKTPESNDHFHISDVKDPSREISCSIITENKLKNISSYNKLEQQVLTEK
ncbi:MAG: hypothetical protein KAU23_01365 [Anaerolineales bacterium]|nr:hypothetical protein [Anaerolineales bacterium]